MLCIISHSILIACIVLAANTFLCIYKGGIPYFRYFRLMKIPLVFLLFSTLAILVNISRTPLDAFAISIGSYYITGSFQGLSHGIQLILTALASVSCLYFLSLNTPMTDILNESTELLCCGKDAVELATSAYHLSADDYSLMLPGVVSRKKQLIPSLITAMQQEDQ